MNEGSIKHIQCTYYILLIYLIQHLLIFSILCRHIREGDRVVELGRLACYKMRVLHGLLLHPKQQHKQQQPLSPQPHGEEEEAQQRHDSLGGQKRLAEYFHNV